MMTTQNHAVRTGDPHPLHLLDLLSGERRGLISVARRFTRDEHQAEDVVQEACLAVLKQPPPLPGNGRAWLRRAVSNLACMTRRAEGRRTLRERRVQDLGGERATGDAARGDDLREHLWSLLHDLPEPLRDAISLHYFSELNSQEIATCLNVPATTVRSRLKRGLDRLRSQCQSSHDSLPLVVF